LYVKNPASNAKDTDVLSIGTVFPFKRAHLFITAYGRTNYKIITALPGINAHRMSWAFRHEYIPNVNGKCPVKK